MSIKRKLVMSNIIMLLIPIIFVLILNTAFRHTLGKRLLTQNEAALNVRRLTDTLRNLQNTGDIVSAGLSLEQEGAFVYLSKISGEVYMSDGFAERMVERTAFANAFSNINYLAVSGPIGSELYIKNEGGEKMHVLSDKPLPASLIWGDRESEFEAYMHRLMVVMILSTLFVTILTNWILTTLMLRSVLNPLKILHEGTNRIKHGDLEKEVVYSKHDEFGEVCANFDDMRVRMKQSIAEQRKYEENKKELIAGISHDLLTPLTHIKGYVAGILDGVANTPEKVDNYLRTINQTTDTMRKMVDNLFMFSKLDMYSVSLLFELTDLVPYFADCCQDLQTEMDRQGMDLFLETEAVEAFVLLEKDQFRRVILNIFENSVKYKKEGRGSITVSITKDQNDVTIVFTDRGVGVDEGKLSHIFEVFYRTDSARSETGKGSGLGLAIVKQIVELHNGRVSARLEKDGGLGIIIALPNARGGIVNEKDTDN